MAFAPGASGLRLAVAWFDGRVEILDAGADFETVASVDQSGACWSLASSAHPPALLAATSDRGSIVVREVDGLRPVAVLPGPGDKVLAIATSADGRQVLSGAADGTVRRHTLVHLTPEIALPAGVMCLAYSPSGRLAAGLDDGAVAVIDGESMSVRHARSRSRAIERLAWNENGSALAAADDGGQVSVWRPGDEMSGDGATVLELGRAVDSLVFLVGGGFAAAASRNATAQIRRPGHEAAVVLPETTWRTALDATSGRIACGLTDGAVVLVDPDSGRPATTIGAGSTGLDHVQAIAFNADGRQLAAATLTKLRLWPDGLGRAPLEVAIDRAVRDLCFSSSGRRVAGAMRDGHARIWDARTGAELLELEPEGMDAADPPKAEAVAFGPDDAELAVGYDDGRVVLFRAPAPGRTRTP